MFFCLLPCSIGQFFRALPLVWLLLMPLYGTVWGLECVVRQCILCLAHLSICQAISATPLGKISSCIEGVLFLGMLALPYPASLPNVIVTGLASILWLIEPVALLFEAYQCVSLAQEVGKSLVEYIDDYSIAIKTFILTIAGGSYLATFALILQIKENAADGVQMYLLYALIILIIALQVACIIHEEGIICDSALIALASVFFYYISFTSSQNTGPVEWSSLYNTEDRSLLWLMLELPRVTTAYASHTVSRFHLLFGPQFWFLTAIRLSAILLFLYRIYRNNQKNDFEWEGLALDDTDENADFGIPYILEKFSEPSFLLKSLGIVIYTQCVIGQLWGRPSWLPSSSLNWGRVFQSGAVDALYIGFLLFPEFFERRDLLSDGF